VQGADADAIAFLGEPRARAVQMRSGVEQEADLLVAATGLRPNIDYLTGSGLDTAWGILVDDHLRTNLPDVYAAGRLDYDSEGLVLLTNDGWLLHRLTHPRYEHPKTYLVQVERVPDEGALETLRRGVLVKGERTLPAEVELLRGDERPTVPPRSVPIRHRENVPTAWLRVTLRERRKRQVRHMTAAVGHPTLRLIRVSSGPIALGDLAPGTWRELTDEELEALSRALHLPRSEGSAPTRAPAPGASSARRSRSRR